MIPKYYFASAILQDETLTAQILPEGHLTPIQCYQKRTMLIQKKLDAMIETLPSLVGPDILELIRQREDILRRLHRHGSLWLLQQDKPFLLVLQRILRVTPQAIGGYRAAMEKLLLDTDTTLVLDGGATRLVEEGREYICKTVLSGDAPTVEKCRELLEKLAQYHCFPQIITLYLPNRAVWDYDATSDRLTRREGEGTAPMPSDPLLLE